MTILQICRECGLPITSDLQIARGQAVCCCEKPKGGIVKIEAPCAANPIHRQHGPFTGKAITDRG